MMSFRPGEAVIFQDEKYKYRRRNPDGSYELIKWGSNTPDAIVNAPSSEVRSFLREGRSDTIGKSRING